MVWRLRNSRETKLRLLGESSSCNRSPSMSWTSSLISSRKTNRISWWSSLMASFALHDERAVPVFGRRVNRVVGTPLDVHDRGRVLFDNIKTSLESLLCLQPLSMLVQLQRRGKDFSETPVAVQLSAAQVLVNLADDDRGTPSLHRHEVKSTRLEYPL